MNEAPYPQPPQGIDPLKVPPIDQLNALSEQDIYTVIDHWQTANLTTVHAQFWIDELSRRRTEGVLHRIADATTESADHVEQVARLTDKGAGKNRIMVKLTVANVAIAAIAVVVSVVALVQ